MKSVFAIISVAMFAYLGGIAQSRVGKWVDGYEVTAWDSVTVIFFVAVFWVLGYLTSRSDGIGEDPSQSKEGK